MESDIAKTQRTLTETWRAVAEMETQTAELQAAAARNRHEIDRLIVTSMPVSQP